MVTIEDNIRLSFSYVKKDLLRANDQITDLKEQIQHLSLNQATLLGEIERLRGKKTKTSNSKKAKKTIKKTKKPVKKKVVKETVTYS